MTLEGFVDDFEGTLPACLCLLTCPPQIRILDEEEFQCKKLTITVNEAVYKGLRKNIGPKKRGQAMNGKPVSRYPVPEIKTLKIKPKGCLHFVEFYTIIITQAGYHAVEVDEMISEKTIQEAARRLAEKFHPERIILFGSYARGTADEHSDVDFLVITLAAKKGNRHKMMAAMDGALWGLSIATDIVVTTPDEFEADKQIPGTVARYVSKEGRLLYERKQRPGQKEGKRMAAAR
jgi:predicted nucleotidyltransferase